MKNFEFFCNSQCEFFPCHKVDDRENFNCMFCYCPLYNMECEGNYSILENGIKDCSNCIIPHYDREYIINKIMEVNK